MRVAVLCSARFGLPIVALLAQRRQLASIGVPHGPSHALEALEPMAAHLGVPLVRAGAADLLGLSFWLDAVRADVLLVAGFPLRLPNAVLDRPHLGAYNVHPSPLPRYRGPEPLFWQLYHGEARTALTVHRMTAAFDAGPVVHTEPVTLRPNDTYGLAEARLMDAAPTALQALLALLDQYGAGVPGTPLP